MGAKDTYTKKYLNDNEVFADVFNYIIYGGEQTIDPDALTCVDVTEIAVPYSKDSAGDNAEAIQKYRDILKSSAIKQDGETTYLLLGIEAQSDIHYAMPVKTAIYDMLQYEKQISEVAAKHKRNKDFKGRSGAEYLSGFLKEDKLTPVITVVILFSPDEWDGPKSLYEMMDIKDEKVKKLVQDYRINLIAPYDIGDEEFSKFTTDLQEVLRFIKVSSDPEKMKEHIEHSEKLKDISTPAARVINECAKLELKLEDGKERTDMCRAIDILNQRAADEGYKRAKEETAKKLLKNGISKDVVVDCTGLTEKEVDDLLLQPT